MPRAKGQVGKGTHKDIIMKVFKELNGKVSEEDIEKVVTMFWSYKFGLLKYLKGYKSFSIKRLLFFSVFKNKLSLKLAHKLKQKYKHNQTYLKKHRKKKKSKRRVRKKL